VAVAVVGLVLAADQGGYEPSVWAPAGLLVIALGLAVAVGVLPAPAGRPLAVWVSIAGLTGFAVWSLGSVVWAGDRAAALEGGGRAALYAAALPLLLVPWSRAAVRAALAVVVGGAVLVGAITLVRAAGSNGASLFVGGRLSDPLGYANATANFWLVAFFPAIGLAVARGLPIALRSLALGAAGLLLSLCLLSQSRGAVLAFAVTACILVAVHPRRGPVLAGLAAVAAAVGVSSRAVLRVRDARVVGDLARAAGHAAVLSAATGAALVVACAAVLVLQRSALNGRAARLTSPVLGDRVAIGLLVAAVAGWLIVAGNPVSWTEARWQSFKSSGYTSVESAPTRFNGSLGSSRYDFYRVAIDEFLEHPLVGIGADNFQVAYLEHRRSPETPVYPHSLELGIVSQGGLVGAAAFVLFLGGLVAAVRRSLRRLGAARGPAVAALCGGLVWLIHSSFDWLWAFPGLALPALALLAAAAGGWAVEGPPAETPAAGVALDAWGRPLPTDAAHAGAPAVVEPPPAEPPAVEPPAVEPGSGGRRAGRSPPARGLRIGLAGATAAGLAVVFVALGVASHLQGAADAEAARDPAQAREDFGRAADLDPFAAGPLISEAILARRAGALGEAAQDVGRAIDREPDSWFAHFELGLLSAVSGDLRRAGVELARARALNPREAVTGQAQQLVAAGRTPDPDALEGQLAAEQSANLGPTAQ
jgi:O-antigen ligase/polysaccharide polymerase Wzy-like membrane protein